MTQDTEQVALAIEHMKVDQLTRALDKNEQQRQAYALVAKSAMALNAMMLKKLHELENEVVNAASLTDAHDRVADVRRYLSNQAELLDNEWQVQCNSESFRNDPRKSELTPGMYIRDGSINEYTGFNR